jgi:hypothetical protein
MKIPLVLLFFVIILGPIFTNAYGFTPFPQSDPSLPEISLQLLIRNSDGNLIAYVEPTIKYISNLHMLHKYLDTMQNKTIITKGGQSFEVIQSVHDEGFDTLAQYSSFIFSYNGTDVLEFTHDGYIAGPGDTITVSLKVIRVVH